jgi:hypothetical protein
VIYRKYQIEKLSYYWLIAELDKKSNIAFGYANLNNDLFGNSYIDPNELALIGVKLDEIETL